MFTNDNPQKPTEPTNGRSSEFSVPYGDYAGRKSSLYQMPSDLLGFTKESVKPEIERCKKAIEKLQAANKLIPYLQKFQDEWNEFLSQLRVLRQKMARGEIVRSQFESASRVLASNLAASLEAILGREQEATNRISQRTQQIKQRTQPQQRQRERA